MPLGGSAALLVALMFAGSIALWIGVPLAWLWIGSRVQAGTGSVGYALLAMMCGMMVTVGILVPLLAWLNRRHVELRAAQGRDVGRATALEQILVLSGAVAIVCFGAWFLVFSGSEPLPLKIGY